MRDWFVRQWRAEVAMWEAYRWAVKWHHRFTLNFCRKHSLLVIGYELVLSACWLAVLFAGGVLIGAVVHLVQYGRW